MTEYELTVVIERGREGRYVAICAALQGCYSEGRTEAADRDLTDRPW